MKKLAKSALVPLAFITLTLLCFSIYGDQWKINFQPTESISPSGYDIDDGEEYDPSPGYGWIVDSDADGLPDWWEREYFGNLTHGPEEDSDNDGLANSEELSRGTIPTNSDSDGDEATDGDEVEFGYDPLDGNDIPDYQAGIVTINEVVASPQQDWNDDGNPDAGDRDPFDYQPWPGDGGENPPLITHSDEWVELYNASASSVNLSGWFLVINDNTPETLRIHPGHTEAGNDDYSAVYVFSVGSAYNTFHQGNYMVVGDPEGMMSNSVFIELRDIRGHLIDTVELGDDPENDNEGNGAPHGGSSGGSSTSSDTESVFRYNDGQDSDTDENGDPWNADVDDFVQGPATICDANIAPSAATPGCVVVNEVVTDPRQDWSDSSQGNDAPFDNIPGTAAPDWGDQWIEVYNTSVDTQDLTGWTLRIDDGSAITIQGLGAGGSVYAFSGSSTFAAFQSGDYLVIGNPEGELPDDVYIELRDGVGTLIDSVELGNDPEDDGAGDGAPDGTGNGGKANDIGSEAIARSPNGSDTDTDVTDFTQQAATICAANLTLSPADPGDVVINEVVTDPQQDWSDSYGGNGSPFDPTPGTGVVDAGDEWIELYNRSGSVVDLSGWSLEMNDSAGVTQTLGSGSSVTLYSAGSSLTACQPGGFILIGDPTGALDNDCFIELKDGLGNVIDTVELGDDSEEDGTEDGAPDGGPDGGASTGTEDEAVARIPDGQDSDPDEDSLPEEADVDDFDWVEASPCGPNPYEAPPAGPAIVDLGTDADIYIKGADPGDLSGTAVSLLGDVNDDGLGDLLIGAYKAGSYRGESYIIYGSGSLPSEIDLSTDADVTITGAMQGDYAGCSVSGGGDINNDDVADIVLGARAASPSGRNEAGECYAVFGGDNLPATIDLGSDADVRVYGAEAGDHAGLCMVISPDVNNDSIGDLLIGSPYADPAGVSDAGSVHIIYGEDGWSVPATLDLSTDPDITLSSSAGYSRAGYSISAFGDINDDLLSDIVIGAPLASPGETTWAGRIFVVYGSGSLSSTNDLESQADLVINGEEEYAEAGFSVSSGGDINNDGVGDILVGAPYASPDGKTWAGKAYVVYGGSSLASPIDLGQADVIISGQSAYDNLGYSVTCTGDHDGDGFDDIVLGAPGADVDQEDEAGKTYVIYGRNDLSAALAAGTDADVIYAGETAGDRSGTALSISGSVNDYLGDDLVIGAPGADPDSRSDAGATYIIYGVSLPTPTPTVTPTTTATPTPTFTPTPTVTPSATATPSFTPSPTSTHTSTPTPTVNLLLNPSFEDSPELVHWTEVGTAASIGWSTQTAKDGSYSCTFTDPTSSYDGRGVRSDNVAVTEFEHYSFGGWFYVAEEAGAIADTRFRLRIEWRDSVGEELSSYPGTTGFYLSAFDTWEKKEFVDVTSPTNAAYMSLLIEGKESVNNNNDAYIDHFSLYRYILPTPTQTPTITPTPTPTLALDVVVNEVMANPVEVGDDHDEYIEIYNPQSYAIDLSDCLFTDGDDVNDPLIAWNEATHGNISDTDCVFDTTTIPAGGYAVILDQQYEEGTQPYDFPAGTIVLTTTDSTLGDELQSTDPVTLYLDTSPSKTILSTYGSPNLGDLTDPSTWDDDGVDNIPLNPSQGHSAIRIDHNTGDIESNWKTSSTPDPGGPNFIPTPTPTPLPGQSGDILINEVVACPLRDWNDAGGTPTPGITPIPFDDAPGNYEVDSEDEWLELYNASGDVLDLTDWSIVTIDLSVQEQEIGGDPAATVWKFSDPQSSVSAFQPGDYLVVGNPKETLSNDVYIEVRNAFDEVIDSIELGDDPEDDGEGDGAPDGSNRGGLASHVDAEAIARAPNGSTTGDDVADFYRLPATIGSANPATPAAPSAGDILVNEVVTDPKEDWSDSVGGVGDPFDSDPGTGVPDAGDQWIELYNPSGSTLSLAGWSLRVESEFGLQFSMMLGVDSACLSFSSGSSLGSLLSGGYMVVGDLPAALGHRVLVELLSPSGDVIDSVELGDDPRRDGAGNCAPAGASAGGETGLDDVESVGRSPNAADTDDDAADLSLLPSTICAQNPSPQSGTKSSIVINEVVTDPRADWSDSENGGGSSFDSQPGDGEPDSDDEWIELYNTTASSIDVTGWTLTMTDSTPETQLLGGGDSIYVFSAGSISDFPSYAYLVIGNPAGALSDGALIELRDGSGTLIDSVQLGEGGAPDGGSNGGKAASDAAEAVARVPNGEDNDDDTDDFIQYFASIGAQNPSPPTYSGGAVLINEVVTQPRTDWNDSEEGNEIPFDSVPGTGSVNSTDEWIELYNDSGGQVDLAGWTVAMTDAYADTQSLGGGSSVYRLTSSTGLGSFSNGDYLVIGNPVESLDNDVFLELRDAWGNLIDDVEIGDDPEEGDNPGDGAPDGTADGGYSHGPGDEAVARVPNAADTGVDVDDFESAYGTIGSANPSVIYTPTVTPTPSFTPTPTITLTPTITPTPIPPDQDTDNDGITDYDEQYVYLTDPDDADSDDDGIDDGSELDYWEGREEDPLDPSYNDGDGELNLLLDADSDEDGMNDGAELANATDPLNPDTQLPTIGITYPTPGQVFN